MKVSVEKKKAEAVERMKKFGVYKPTVRQFEKQGLVSLSEPPFGACYWLDDKEMEEVRKFEKEYNAVVYHVIRSFTEFGVMDAYLYVSDYEEEWEYDRDDIKLKQQVCYVVNRNMPDCSEFGSIGIELTQAAGLRRTW